MYENSMITALTKFENCVKSTTAAPSQAYKINTLKMNEGLLLASILTLPTNFGAKRVRNEAIVVDGKRRTRWLNGVRRRFRAFLCPFRYHFLFLSCVRFISWSTMSRVSPSNATCEIFCERFETEWLRYFSQRYFENLTGKILKYFFFRCIYADDTYNKLITFSAGRNRNFLFAIIN